MSEKLDIEGSAALIIPGEGFQKEKRWRRPKGKGEKERDRKLNNFMRIADRGVSLIIEGYSRGGGR